MFAHIFPEYAIYFHSSLCSTSFSDVWRGKGCVKHLPTAGCCFSNNLLGDFIKVSIGSQHRYCLASNLQSLCQHRLPGYHLFVYNPALLPQSGVNINSR